MKIALGISATYAIADISLFFRNLNLVKKFKVASIGTQWDLKQLDIKTKGFLYVLYKKKITFDPPVYLQPKDSPVAIPLSNGTYRKQYHVKGINCTFETSDQNILELKEDQLMANFETKYFKNDLDYQDFCKKYQFDPLQTYTDTISKTKPDKNPFLSVQDIKIKFINIDPSDTIWIMSKDTNIDLLAKSCYDSFSAEAIHRCRLPLRKTNFLIMIILIVILCGEYNIGWC